MSYARLSRLPPLTGKNISRISNRAASSLHHGLTQTTTKDDTGVILYINKDNCHKQHKDGQKLTHRSPKKPKQTCLLPCRVSNFQKLHVPCTYPAVWIMYACWRVCVFTCMPRTSARVCVCVGISGVKRAGLGAVRADGAAESRGQFGTPQYATSTGDCRFVLFLRMRTCDSQSIIGHARVPVSAASCPDPSPLCCLSHGVFLIQVRAHTHTHTASHSLESGSWNRIWCVYVYEFVCVYVSKLTAVQSLWMFQQAVSFYQSNSINVCKAELQLSDWMCVWRSLHAEVCVITRISVLFFLLLCLE